MECVCVWGAGTSEVTPGRVQRSYQHPPKLYGLDAAVTLILSVRGPRPSLVRRLDEATHLENSEPAWKPGVSEHRLHRRELRAHRVMRQRRPVSKDVAGLCNVYRRHNSMNQLVDIGRP